jgi:hypothetical protein
LLTIDSPGLDVYGTVTYQSVRVKTVAFFSALLQTDS